MPQHFSFTNAPPPPSPALMQYLAMLLGSGGAAQFGAPPAAGGGVPAQLAGAQALKQSVMAGVPSPAEHPTPNLDMPRPVVDTSSRDNLLGAADLLASLGGGAAEPSAPSGGWTPAATPGNEPSNFLADLFGGKDASQNLLQFGLRMMAGSQPQAGATVGPSLFGAVGEAGVGTLAAAAHRKAEQARQERRRRKEEPARQRESARAKLSGGYDPTTDITWEGGRAGQSPKQRKALFAQGFPGQAGAQMGNEIFGTGGPTDPQIANNSEIDQARLRLEELEQGLQNGSTLAEELNRRMSSTDPSTGLLTPDFSSFWGQIARTAMQAKVGVPDPDQAMWSRRLMLPPEFSDPAGSKPLPPGLGGAEPSGIEGFLKGLFGGDASGAAPTSPTTQPGSMPRPGVQGGSPISPNPLAGSFLNPAGATAPVPGQTPRAPGSVPGGPRVSQPGGSGGQRAFNPRGLPSGRPAVPGSTPRGAGKPITEMSMSEVIDFLDARGESLTVAERNQMDARLRALGF